MVMDIVSPGISDYIDSLPPAPEPPFAEMEAHAAQQGFPIVGPQVGRLLYQLVGRLAPHAIFEMGSGFGYSACWMLKAPARVRMVCTEKNNENVECGKRWMQELGVLDRADWRCGDALDFLRAEQDNYDMIFNDVDKAHYPEAFEIAMEHLKKNGLLITDNLLWSGRVLDADNHEASTQGIRTYNRLIFETPGVFSSILPIRDGIGITWKL